ncbi:unnamed protein product [Brassicogethes aeneus]|uniref:Uncharacterized protein n=1 Tax=Brassicogethes aeneus TaxID=1431903 RepID=A0A9P0BDC0_BRAAE|nr:unnamed protein product [Brassicogethes aeneus]
MQKNSFVSKYSFKPRTLRILKNVNTADPVSSDEGDVSDHTEYIPKTDSEDSSDTYFYHSSESESDNIAPYRTDTKRFDEITEVNKTTTKENISYEGTTSYDGVTELRYIVMDSIENTPFFNDFENTETNRETISCKDTAFIDEKNKKDNISQTNKSKRVRRKHSCIFCDVLVTNFARHLERCHSDELEVQRFLSLTKNDPERKCLIDKIRKEGDFSTGEKIPVLKVCSDTPTETNLLPCIFCKGYYAKKTLRRHVKRCKFNKIQSPTRHSQSQAQNMMVNHFGPNDPLRTSGVLNSLAADEISLAAKKDKIICEVGRQYVKCHKDKHLVQVAKRQMRRLARLVIEARKIENNFKLTLFSLLHPSKFKTIVKAVRDISQYNIQTNSFGSPSLALQMGTLIKKAINAAYSAEIQRDVNSKEINNLNAMKNLINDQWASEVSTEAGQNLNINRFNKPTLIPTAEDIAKFKKYLDELLDNFTKELNKAEENVKAYKTLSEVVYCSLLLFNRRRVGELQRIPLEIYLKNHNSQSSKEFENLLTPSEKILLSSLKRIVIKGKRGRGVPVLFDQLTTRGIESMIKKRNVYFKTYNEYLFGIPNTNSCISGYQVLRKHATIALGDAKKIQCLTSTRLRKHLATICQIMKMGNSELEQLAKFMGHTSKTHEEWYRLPSDVYQTAKVSKILLLSQIGSIEKFKGCNIDEISLDDKIVESQKSDSEESDVEVNDNNENFMRPSVDENKEKKVKRRRLCPWSDKEKKVTEDFFKTHIKQKKAPKKAEVTELINKYPDLFKNRTWATIKVYVQNKYK